MRFSDKPLRVDGVKYQPKWLWSDAYRKDFRKTYGKTGFPALWSLPPKDALNNHLNSIECGYHDWLCEHKNMSHSEAHKFINARRTSASASASAT